jgi:hypothetical protein
MNKPICVSCSSGRGKRDCPVLGGLICAVCCGSERNSTLQCTAECPNNPFGRDNYDEWLKLDRSYGDRCMRYLVEHYPCDEYSLKKNLANYVLDDSSVHELDEEAISNAIPLFMHARLFWEPYRDERCLADYWERENWKGLNNDEQVMMKFRRTTFPVILEIQDIIDDTSSRCVDLLDPEKKEFTVYDRNMAAQCTRFTRSVNMVCPFPHYFRVGPTGVELEHELTESFMEKITASAENEGVSTRDYLRKHYVEACRLVHRMRRKQLESIIDSMDISACKAVYRLNISQNEVAKVLSMKPEFQPEKSKIPGALDYLWLRKGESKKIEKKMPAVFRHHDEDSEAGILGELSLLADTLEVTTFGSQKFKFARKMIEKYLGACITFMMETEKEVKKEAGLQKPKGRYLESEMNIGVESAAEEIPPEIRAEALNQFNRNHYRRFIDEPVPMLDDMSPRAAAADPEHRPKLLELMKLHLHGIEKRNRMDPCLNLEIDWVLDELGLEELKKQ